MCETVMTKMSVTRRRFGKTSAGLLAGGLLGPQWFTASIAKALEPTSKNDRLVFGAIGMGPQGMHITGEASRFGDIVAVCDVDRNRAEEAKNRFGGKAEIHDDHR